LACDLERASYLARMNSGQWIVTVDSAYPSGVFELPDGRLNFLLRLLVGYDAAVTLPLDVYADRTLAVTLTITAATAAAAVERAEMVLGETLCSLGLGEDWSVVAVEVCADEREAVVRVRPQALRAPLARTA
jgi:hypothetical protein